MNQFDKTTERTVKNEYPWHGEEPALDQVYREGRNSTKASMEILARDLMKRNCNTYIGVATPGKGVRVHSPDCRKCRIIAAVKANGDWPLVGAPSD